jgi:putative copper resistance protein D
LTADVLHLLAAATWTGGLVSLALLLATARRNRSSAWASLARDVAQRFSTLGIISVGALLLTGIVNAWILVGSLNALIVSEYGRLLMIKVGFFGVMVAFAGVNRLRLVPQLAVLSERPARIDVLRQLTRNSIVELTLGVMVFAIVGALGTLHPAIHGY